MTTRRNVIAGLATAAALPAVPGTAEAAAPLQTAPAAPEQPSFAYDLDRRVWGELESLEGFLAKMKRQLALVVAAGDVIERQSLLIDMRCTHTAVSSSQHLLEMAVMDQRAEGYALYRAESAARKLAADDRARGVGPA